jgi:hypothetical protein
MSLMEKLIFSQSLMLLWSTNLLRKCNSLKEANKRVSLRQNSHKSKKTKGKKKKEKRSRKKSEQRSKETSSALTLSRSKKKIRKEAKVVLIRGKFALYKDRVAEIKIKKNRKNYNLVKRDGVTARVEITVMIVSIFR